MIYLWLLNIYQASERTTVALQATNISAKVSTQVQVIDQGRFANGKRDGIDSTPTAR